MPFDAMPEVRNETRLKVRYETRLKKMYPPVPLARALMDLGIQPVPDTVVAKHKRQMIAAHPPSWLYRRLGYVASFVILSLFGSWLGLVLSLACHWGGGAVCGAFGLCFAIFLFFWLPSIKVRGPAEWRGRHVPLAGLAAPTPILQLAHRVCAACPTATFCLGELIQNKVVLDPYLVVQYRGDCAVLGIWENDVIVAISATEQ